MHSLDRRRFLASTTGGLADALAAGPPLIAADGVAPMPRLIGDPLDPDTLFLTWHRDPTTTMVVVWVCPETSQDVTVRCVSRTGETWISAKPTIKPFPGTEWKVYRAEFSGLLPDTEYLMQIGKTGPLSRFRTMPAKATNTISFVSGGDCGVNAHTVA